jgi:hypothetical protein
MFFHHLFIETLPDGAAFRGRIGARVSASFAGRRLVTPAELLAPLNSLPLLRLG